MKWGIVTIMNNTKYYYKSKGNTYGSMLWTADPDNALTWNSKGAVEYYVTRNHMTDRGVILQIKEVESES